jgi:Snf7
MRALRTSINDNIDQSLSSLTRSLSISSSPQKACTAAAAARMESVPTMTLSASDDTEKSETKATTKAPQKRMDWNAVLRQQCLENGVLGRTPQSVLSAAAAASSNGDPVDIALPSASNSVTWNASKSNNGTQSLQSATLQIARVASAANSAVSIQEAAAEAAKPNAGTTASSSAAPKSTSSWASYAYRAADTLLVTPVKTSASLILSPLNYLVEVTLGDADNRWVTEEDLQSAVGTEDATAAKPGSLDWEATLGLSFASESWLHALDATEEEDTSAAVAPAQTAVPETVALNDVVLDVGLAAACARFVQYTIRTTATTPAIVPESEMVPWLSSRMRSNDNAEATSSTDESTTTTSMLSTSVLSKFLARLAPSHWDLILETVLNLESARNDDGIALQRVAHQDSNAEAAAPMSLFVVGCDEPSRTVEVRLAVYDLQTAIDRLERSVAHYQKRVHVLGQEAVALRGQFQSNKSVPMSNKLRATLQQRMSYNKQIDSCRAQMLNLEQMLHTVEGAASQRTTVSALQSAHQSLQALRPAVPPTASMPDRDVHDVLDDVREETDYLNETAAALGPGFDEYVDEDELLQELLQCSSEEPQPVVAGNHAATASPLTPADHDALPSLAPKENPSSLLNDDAAAASSGMPAGETKPAHVVALW